VAEIGSIAVIGAGAIGRGIAIASILGGYRTILEDILPASLRTASAELGEHLSRTSAAGAISQVEASAAFNRLELASTVEDAARQADLVIEAVPDEMESKIEIFTLLDKVCKPATILASNTSSLSLTEIASVTYRAQKILGMRFAAPVAEVGLLEIVRTRQTDNESVIACSDVGRRMGKKVVVIHDGADSAGRR
jgi:3-hydroxybutyryl-CoA dehydrogenase